MVETAIACPCDLKIAIWEERSGKIHRLHAEGGSAIIEKDCHKIASEAYLINQVFNIPGYISIAFPALKELYLYDKNDKKVGESKKGESIQMEGVSLNYDDQGSEKDHVVVVCFVYQNISHQFLANLNKKEDICFLILDYLKIGYQINLFLHKSP